MSSRPPPKKPSGSRPNVRKLLSKDSISSLASFSKHGREPSQGSREGSHITTHKKGHPTLPPLHEDHNGRGTQAPWMRDELVSSPTASQDGHNPFDENHGEQIAKARVKLTKQTLPAGQSSSTSRSEQGAESPVFDSSRSSTSSPAPVSPSKVRWEQLRQHVLPSTSPVPSPDPSFSSFSQLNIPATVVPTPRPSRFAARFGFRQVVNDAQTIADDVTRRFADDVQKACWNVRFVDSRPLKPDREATQPSALGSSLHLPFMSSTSLPLSNNASSNNLSGSSTFKGHRSATIPANLVTQTGFRTAALGSLQSIINRYATIIAKEKPFLPHEKEVLSVLLVAFLTPNSGQDVNDERQVSLEIFESVVRRWKAPNIESTVDRCLWCCKAATASSNLRSRILYLLRGLLSAEDNPLSSTAGLQTVLPHIALLVPHCQNFHPSQVPSSMEKSNDLDIVHDLMAGIIAGERIHLDLDELEQHFEALTVKGDTEDDIREGLCIEALSRTLTLGFLHQKQIMLRILEKYWPSPNLSMSSTPIRTKIHLNKLRTFLPPLLAMLHESLDASAESRLTSQDYRIIIQLVTARVLPEMDNLQSSEGLLEEVQSLTTKVMLTLLSSEIDDEDEEDTFAANVNSEVRNIVLDWLIGKPKSWGDVLQKELKGLATSSEWKVVTTIANRLVSVLPEAPRKLAVGAMILQFHERIIGDPPESSYEPLSRLLASFAAIHPQVFYKPIFACAASVKEETVARQLTLLIGLAHYLPNFWTTDAEMVSVALMSDPTGSGIGKGKAKEGQVPTWGKARLGQTTVVFELISKLKEIREKHLNEHDNVAPYNISITKVLKFCIALEARLAILVDAKEQNTLLTLSQRILFTALFLEIRSLTKSLKQTAWLPRVISWTMQHDDSSESNFPALPEMSEDQYDEVDEMWARLDVVYSLARTSMKPVHQRRNTGVMSPKSDVKFSGGSSDWRESSVEVRVQLLRHLPKNPLPTLLRTLVALSGALKREDYSQLGPFVWDKCLSISDSQTVLHACFICMQSAEKASEKFVAYILAQMQSSDSAIRRKTVQKFGVLSNWRFQLLSEMFITDRNYRRPFKLARPPLNFVATDIGDSKYIPDDDLEEAASGNGHTLPLDIRRRLNEIGWDDEEKPIDQQLEWRRTPMSLLSGSQLDQLAASNSANEDARLSDQSPSPSPGSSGNSPSLSTRSESGLLRRNSSSQSWHAGKRRPVFVQPLVAVFLPLAKLALDNDFSVASAARDLIVDFMRDDPAVLCRPIMDILSGNVDDIDTAISTLRIFLHVSKTLPPRLTHYAFNHLAGFLKLLAKDASLRSALHTLAESVPILSKLAPRVSDMTVRAIRRGKIEVFLFPSGSLYFTEAAPSTPMFPKSPLPATNPFESCPRTLVDMTMIRMSQNLLFVELLKRSPQDVHIVRKSWTPLVLPDVPGLGGDTEVFPRRSIKKSVPDFSKTAYRISLSFSRTHLLFVAQVFRCLTRHLNSREELSMFLDGVNRILLRHGDDVGIVSHALIVYMIASTRFRRLMSSAAGFTVFLPVLIKVYCEAEGDSAVRDAIEYAVHRFFAVHEEVFVYQALQIISGIIAQPSTDGPWISSKVYHLLSSLKGVSIAPDAAGIRDANKAQEEETALAITADERPQMFLASLRKESKAGAEKIKTSLSAEIFDKKKFHPDNIIRMLLTVIAHDPTIRRAQYFVRLFRYLVQELYDASQSARNVLKEAVEALGSIVASKGTKAKGVDTASKTLDQSVNISETDLLSSNKVFGNPSLPCDVQIMRSDYLFIFASYVRCGGAHRDAGLHKALEIAKSVLKEPPVSSEAIDSVRLFLERIGESFSKRQDVKYAVTLLKEFAIIIKVHGSVLDLSGFFKSLTTLCSAPAFANDKKFSTVVVNQVCSAALEICEMAAQENVLSSLKFVPSLVTLLANSVCLLGSDVVAEIERRVPSPAFLSGVVLPFIFQLRTTVELATQTQWTDSWRQDAHAHAWVRLSWFALTVFQNQTNSSLKSRGSVRRSPSFNREPADPAVDMNVENTRGYIRKAKRRPSGQSNITLSVRIAMAFVILKAVILRGEEDVSTLFPGAWLRIGVVLRYMLRDGNAIFALRHIPSAPPSPLSPMSSTTFTEVMDRSSDKRHKRSSSSTSDVFLSAPPQTSRPSSPTRLPSRRNSARHHPCPRLTDYLTWSLLEFLCLHRSPLVIQLRTYVYEKVAPLDELLQGDEPSRAINIGRRKSLRPISTMYTKPRLRSNSAATTPEVSPRLGFSVPNAMVRSAYGTEAHPGAEHAPSSKGPTGGPHIAHIAIPGPPAAPSFLSPSFVPASTSADSHLSQLQSVENVKQYEMVMDAREALASTTLRSSALVKRTYERIRIVQRCLGYNTYLPVPESLIKLVENVPSKTETFDAGGSAQFLATPRSSVILEQEKEPEAHVWTKRKAGLEVMQEAEDLLRAWQVESAIATSTSDADGTVMAVPDTTIDMEYTPTKESFS